MKSSFSLEAEEYESICKETKELRGEFAVYAEIQAYVSNGLGREVVVTGETSREFCPFKGREVVNVFYKETHG